jgi:transmembrane sensor
MSKRTTRIERQAYKWVVKMLDDPGRHAAALERWLSKDPEHRAVYKRVVVEVGQASDSAAHVPSLRESTSSKPEVFIWGGRGRLIAVGAIAVASLVLLAIVGGLHLTKGGVHSISGPDLEQQFASTEDVRIVRLDDGSKVTLLANSRITARYTAGERSVDLLRGTARFDVMHNAARPFVVYAAGGKIVATGTSFEVTISNGVHVRLITGAVTVSLPRSMKDTVKRVVRLSPGQQLIYAPVLASVQAISEASPSAAFLQEIETFDDVPAAEIVEKINRSSAIKIVFADQSSAQRKVVAEFKTDDPEVVAQKLAKLLGLIVDRSQPGRLILKLPN